MTGTFRALLAALIVVAAASAGALYVGYHNGVAAARDPDLAFNVATTGDVSRSSTARAGKRNCWASRSRNSRIATTSRSIRKMQFEAKKKR